MTTIIAFMLGLWIGSFFGIAMAALFRGNDNVEGDE